MRVPSRTLLDRYPGKGLLTVGLNREVNVSESRFIYDFVDFVVAKRIIIVGVIVLAFGIFAVYSQAQLQTDQDNTQAELVETQEMLAATQAELAKTQRCVTAFLTQDSEARKIRSQLVEDESANNRYVIKGVLFDVQNEMELTEVKEKWLAESDRILQERKNNPLKGFDEKLCADFINASYASWK